MNTRMNNSKGLTLIELVVVIIILGIVAVLVIPRIMSKYANADQVAVNRFADSLGTASSINYASCSGLGNVVTKGKCIQVTKCSDIAAAITPPLKLGTAGAAIANRYNLAVDNAVAMNGREATCTLQISKDGITYTKAYVVRGAGNQ